MRKSTPPPDESVDWSAISKAILIRLRSLGDAVLMTPCLRALKEWKKELFLALIIDHPLQKLFNLNPYLDQVIVTYRGKPPAEKGYFYHPKLLWSLLPSYKFDLAINLHGGSRSVLCTYFSQARYKVGAKSFRHGYVYDIAVPPPEEVWLEKPPLHTVKNQLALIKYLGVPINSDELFIPVDEDSKDRLRAKLSSMGIKRGDPFFLIHPAATFPSKRWSAVNFARLADWLRKRYGYPAVVVVGEGEAHIAHEIAKEMRKPLTCLIAPPLDELVALIDEGLLFIGNDSGPMHLAAALKKNIVAIFGASNPRQWHPWKTSYSLIRYPLPCSPCPGKKCPQQPPYPCIRLIGIEEVKRGVMEQIDQLGKQVRAV